MSTMHVLDPMKLWTRKREKRGKMEDFIKQRITKLSSMRHVKRNLRWILKT